MRLVLGVLTVSESEGKIKKIILSCTLFCLRSPESEGKITPESEGKIKYSGGRRQNKVDDTIIYFFLPSPPGKCERSWKVRIYTWLSGAIQQSFS
jgi:hypothetical protein